jgi:hypothetical protein
MRRNHSTNHENEERRDDFPVSQGREVGFMGGFLLNRKVYNRGGRPMQQRKFMTCLLVALVCTYGSFFSSVAMAEIVPPTYCNTFSAITNSGPILNDSNPIISIDNTGQWPVVIDNKSADNDNVCNNTLDSNYPCTVFKYKIDNFNSSSFPNYQHTIITIPTCLDNSMEIPKGETYPSCNPTISGGNPDGSFYACAMRNIRQGKSQYFSFPVKGKEVGIGVISITLVANNTTPNINYNCFNPVSKSGILGPACGVKTTEPETTCAPSVSSASTTNYCLENVAGNIVKVDAFNDAITAVYTCSGLNCTGTCTPQVTYEALADIEICDPTGANCVQTGKKCQINAQGDPDCEVVAHAGGTAEESIGYFVVSDPSGTTICLIAQANTICFTE